MLASRMSNERIGIYLSNVSFVDQIISMGQTMNIKDKEINGRCLINPGSRIFFFKCVTL